MKITFLGTGTSQGVPVIGCKCEVCKSTDSKDKRLRTSAMVEVEDKRFIIDAGPDFRYQMLRAGISKIDALLLTHEHKDHTGGIDDVRAFNFVDYPIIHTIHIYSNSSTIEAIRRDFHYAFATDKYRGVPEIRTHIITEQESFFVEGIEITPIVGQHSERFRSVGYRIGNLAYLTDMNYIAPEEIAKLRGVEVLVINALRWETHSSHFSVEEAIKIIDSVAPKRAYLTHMSHRIGLHSELEHRLPKGVMAAYDGLEVEI
ncbi:MAG: MBL fold metallo-hydrolase [Alistipes sp.]|nr:MBL fold metallo-hydrolase [Alistipes sp.]